MVTRGKGIILGAVFALAVATAAAQGTLAGVETQPVGEGIEVQILGDNLAKPKEIRVNGNKSYILEFDAKLLGRAQRKNIGQGGLSYWSCVWYSARPPKVRVLLQIGADDTPALEQNEKGWIVHLNVPSGTGGAIPMGATVPPIRRDSGAAKPPADAIPPDAVVPPIQSVSDLVSSLVHPAGKTQPKVETTPPSKDAIPPDAVVPPLRSADEVLSALNGQDSKAVSTTKAMVRAQTTTPPAKVPTTNAAIDLALNGVDPTVKAAVNLAANPKAPARPKTSTVSLDFVNAEVVQILKALALQANVNIVTAPEVKGALTVTLDRVSVEEALDFVTTMTGLRYGRVGNTYMVTSAGKYAEAMRTLTKRGDEAYETRVVPIYSGAGTQIKASILRSIPSETTEGTFEIVLPSEETKVEKKATVGEAQGAGAEQQAGKGNSTTVESKTTTDAVDAYVVLIGSGTRLTQVQSLVTRLDTQLCQAMGINIPNSSSMARATYQVRGGSATDLMKAVAGEKNKVGNVEISATPSSSSSGQTIVLYGRENEVTHVMQTLAQLDSSDETVAEFVNYDVKYVDPRSLRESLIAAVPGLRATVAPAPAGNPRVYQAGAAKNQGTETVNQSGGSNGAAAGGNAAEVSVKGDSSVNAAEGLGQPFSDYEKVTQPMRLILSGTPEMLDRAKDYLTVVDVAPRQIALELRVMEMSKEDALKLGIDWSLMTGGTVKSFRINQGLGGTPSTPGVSSGSLGFAGGGSADVTAMLDQISDKNNLIARPNLLAIDGRESEIFVGDVVRYVESIVTSQNGTTVTTGEVPVGVRLAVFPRVGGSDSITLDLRPVVSSLTSFTPVPGGGNLPQTSVRIAQSTVNIKSGETIALGGLIHDEDRRIVSGIPILKDLPIVGMLFRRSDTRKVRTEVVMFLTARIVNENNRGGAADPRNSEKTNPDERRSGG
ncbi:MAG: hypothetical protein M9921_06150 [Fimbriimonadaceae bacterium]|nr:hypothetical protein [Fimbriimonadaceae bacterium]